MGMTESVKEDATYEALVDERSSWSRDIRQHIEKWHDLVLFCFHAKLYGVRSDVYALSCLN